MTRRRSVLCVVLLLTGCGSPTPKTQAEPAAVLDEEGGPKAAEPSSQTEPTTGHELEPSFELVLASEVTWDHLNPARGDKAPQAATLWGDRNGAGPTGFLLKPSDGFSSPPHLHNVSYRGIVLSGLIHNDDPQAETIWMPRGSFWTQPKGQIHITSARGADVLAYIEIEAGPYLVLPTEKKFDSGERPVNVDASNVVWVDASQLAFVEPSRDGQSGEGVQVAFLWGGMAAGDLRGHLVRLPAGFLGELISESPSFRAVVVEGKPELQLGPAGPRKTLDKGSYFSSTGHWRHRIVSPAETPTVLYVRSDRAFRITQGG